MSVIAWPGNRPIRRPNASGPTAGEALPTLLLHSMVANLPGPANETEPQRDVRFQAQLAEVLSYHPRNTADAMLATHCIMMRLLAAGARLDAARSDPATAKKCLRSAREFDGILLEMQQALQRRQAKPLPSSDPAAIVAPGMEQVPLPATDIEDEPEEAFSAVIVPLHPAPRMLQ